VNYFASKILKRLILGITLCAFTFFSFAKPAHAIVPIWSSDLSGPIPALDTSVSVGNILNVAGGWDIGKESSVITANLGDLVRTLLPTSWDGIAWYLAKFAVNAIREQTIVWIQNGFEGGGPLFVTNPQQFFMETADEASGVFVAQLGNQLTGDPNYFCRDFAPQIVLELGLGKRFDFNHRAKCTINDVADNFQNFMDDFSHEGKGWDNLFKVRETNNNGMAFYLEAFHEQQVRADIRLNDEYLQTMWGNGNKTERKCEQGHTVMIQGPDQSGNPIPAGCSKYKTNTPGKVIGDRLAKTVGLDYDTLITADELSEVVQALLNEAIQLALENLSGS
jgi:hypothetical protein